MPIITGTVGETIIQLGDGDVRLSTGRQPENSFDNEVCFIRDEPRPIGEPSKKYADGTALTADVDCPVRLQFSKVESIDVLIERLQKVRGQMTNALAPETSADKSDVRDYDRS